MTERVSASVLDKGARVLVVRDADGDPVPAKSPEGAEVATVTARPSKDGRKLVVDTDLGAFAAGPTAKILLAPAVEPEPERPPARAVCGDCQTYLDAPGVTSTRVPGLCDDCMPARPPATLDGLPEAVVTLDAAGRVTPDSVVTVGGESAHVPEHCPRTGYAVAPLRLIAALSSIGFEPVSSWALADGVAKCKVRANRP